MGQRGKTRVQRWQHKQKHRSALRNYGVDLVAWGGIEPPAQGFSTHTPPTKETTQRSRIEWS
jgi:hypothetical protein